MHYLHSVKHKYLTHFKEKGFVISLITSLVLLVAGLSVNVLAGIYATNRASGSVSDIVLSNIPAMNVDDLFVYGPILFWIIVSIYFLSEPKRIPFWLKSVALFIVIRSIFITLTHIGPFPDHIPVDSFNILSNFNFYIFNSGADLFFSAHTGLPFLNALILWKHPRMRWFCLLSAIFFGVIVLLGHLHYSIDVLSAFFITYTIYHIAIRLFRNDFEKGEN